MNKNKELRSAYLPTPQALATGKGRIEARIAAARPSVRPIIRPISTNHKALLTALRIDAFRKVISRISQPFYHDARQLQLTGVSASNRSSQAHRGSSKPAPQQRREEHEK